MEIAAIISSVLSLIGVIVTSAVTHRKIVYELHESQAVMAEQISGMRKELEEMNKEVKNIPVMLYRLDQVEQEVNRIKEKIV